MKLKNLCVKIQSWTDIITNSSSEIFCQANNPEFLKSFIKSVIHLIDPSIQNIDDIIKICIIPDREKILDLLEDYDWMKDLFNSYNIDIDHFTNALSLSTNTLVPLDVFLQEYNLTCDTIFNDIIELAYDHDYTIGSDYVIIPANNDVELDLINKLNLALDGLAYKLYEITERYN